LSFVVPTYNMADMLGRCLMSLVEQEYPPGGYEVVVVDDGSTDETESVVRQFVSGNTGHKVLYVRHERNMGVASARNSGIERSSGGFIAVVADDYVLPRDYLRKAESFFASRSDAYVMACRIVGEDGSFFSRLNQLYFNYSIYNAYRVPYTTHGLFLRRFIDIGEPLMGFGVSLSGAALVRRGVYEAFGPYDVDLRIGEDTEYGFRLAGKKIPIYLNPSIVVLHKHKGGLFKSLLQKFEYGRGAYRFKMHCPAFTLVVPDSMINSLICIIRPFPDAVARCMFAGGMPEFFAFLPFMLLFTLAYNIGVFYGALEFMASIEFRPRDTQHPRGV